MHLTRVERVVPRLSTCGQQVGGHRRRPFDVPDRRAVLGHDAGHRRAVLCEACKRPHTHRDLGGLAIGTTRHQRAHRSRVGATLLRVVRKAAGHQECAEVRIAEAELAEGLRVALDLRRRIRGIADKDLLCEEHYVDGVFECLDIELTIFAAEFHQI